MLKSTPQALEADERSAEVQSVRALFDREESNLLRYAFALTGRRVVAEEIVQDVFLQAHAKWDEIEAPTAWVFRCVRNRALNHLRKSKREILQRDETMETTQITDDEDGPSALLARMESADRLRELLDTLCPQDLRLVKLKYFEGLKYREISEQTGLSISNVGFRLHTILKQLASGLEPPELKTHE